MKSIHISVLRHMLAGHQPVDLKCWKKDGSIMELKDALPLRYDFYGGTQHFKMLASQQIRTVRICLIFEINGMEVFM